MKNESCSDEDSKTGEEYNIEDEDVPLSRFKCSSDQWNDWQWQMRNRIRTVEQLKQFFPEIDIPDLKEVISKYPFAITPYYSSKIKKFDFSDPVFALSIPQIGELHDSICLSDDPLHESEDMIVPFLVHRYKDRCLLMCTSTCSSYCRHCTRKRLAGKKESHISSKRLSVIKDYLLTHPEIRDVIISGGDPLTQENSVIEEVLKTVRSVPTVDIIRIGTRVPVVLPQRVTPKLISLLKKYKPL